MMYLIHIIARGSHIVHLMESRYITDRINSEFIVNDAASYDIKIGALYFDARIVYTLQAHSSAEFAPSGAKVAVPLCSRFPPAITRTYFPDVAKMSGK